MKLVRLPSAPMCRTRKKPASPGFFLCFAACVALFCCVAVVGLSAKRGAAVPEVLPVSVTVPLLGEGAGSPPQTYAKAACLIDGKSGAVLYEKSGNLRLPMASTTKIMTALVVLEHLPFDTIVTVPKEATLVEGSSVYLRESEKITVKELLYGLLLESGNDAAHTLAVAVAGDLPSFAALMNQKAAALGLHDTHFENPHGLSADGHYTTAYELARITAEAMKNEFFRSAVATKKHVAPALDGELTRYFFNHNKLLRLYDGACGVKTGFTKAAGRCLVSAAERDGSLFIAVTLDDSNDWNDHMAMLSYASAQFDTVEIASEHAFGVYAHQTHFSNPDGIFLTVPKGNAPVLSYRAAISETLGTVEYFTADGTPLGKFSLCPDKNADASETGVGEKAGVISK